MPLLRRAYGIVSHLTDTLARVGAKILHFLGSSVVSLFFFFFCELKEKMEKGFGFCATLIKIEGRKISDVRN